MRYKCRVGGPYNFGMREFGWVIIVMCVFDLVNSKVRGTINIINILLLAYRILCIIIVFHYHCHF